MIGKNKKNSIREKSLATKSKNSSSEFSPKTSSGMRKIFKDMFNRGASRRAKSSLNTQKYMENTQVFNNLIDLQTDQTNFPILNRTEEELQQEIDEQKIKYEKMLEEQRGKYYDQIQEKNVIISELNSQLTQYESSKNGNTVHGYSTGRYSEYNPGTKYSSQDHLKAKGIHEEIDMQCDPNRQNSSRDNNFNFLETLAKIRAEDAQDTDESTNGVQRYAKTSSLKGHFRSSLTTKEMFMNTEGSLSSVWSIPDSSKNHPEIDRKTGFNFHCEGCRLDPEYHSLKQLKF